MQIATAQLLVLSNRFNFGLHICIHCCTLERASNRKLTFIVLFSLGDAEDRSISLDSRSKSA